MADSITFVSLNINIRRLWRERMTMKKKKEEEGGVEFF